MLVNKKHYKFINHPYQIVENSPWPFIIGMCAFMYMTLNGIFLSFGCHNFYGISLFRNLYHLSFIILFLNGLTIKINYFSSLTSNKQYHLFQTPQTMHNDTILKSILETQSNQLL